MQQGRPSAFGAFNHAKPMTAIGLALTAAARPQECQVSGFEFGTTDVRYGSTTAKASPENGRQTHQPAHPRLKHLDRTASEPDARNRASRRAPVAEGAGLTPNDGIRSSLDFCVASHARIPRLRTGRQQRHHTRKLHSLIRQATATELNETPASNRRRRLGRVVPRTAASG